MPGYRWSLIQDLYCNLIFFLYFQETENAFLTENKKYISIYQMLVQSIWTNKYRQELRVELC